MKKYFAITLLLSLFSCTNKTHNHSEIITVAKPTPIQQQPSNLDPKTKFNVFDEAGMGSKYLTLSSDSLIINYLTGAPFSCSYNPNDECYSYVYPGEIALRFLGNNSQRNPLRFDFNTCCKGEGRYSFEKQKYDNSRTIHLLSIPNCCTLNKDITSNTTLDITLFRNGTILVNVEKLKKFLNRTQSLTNDTAQYWTLCKYNK